MTTKQKAAIAASLTVLKALSPLPDDAPQITVLHLGHPSDPKYGSVEMMTPAQFEEFRRANTWPKPQRRRREASD